MSFTRLMPLMEADGVNSGGTTPPTQMPNTASQGQQQTTAQETVTFDYDKLAQIIQGKQSVTEDTVLRGYFKQQGLSKEEADQAMTTFKQQKASQQPDTVALQQRATEKETENQKLAVENKAILVAIELGVEARTVPYLLKMADLSVAIDQNGKLNNEALKAAINKVLEHIPALKPAQPQATGFVQVGATGGNQTQTTDTALKAAFGL